MSIMHLVENKDTGLSEHPPEGVVALVFNRSGACLMCGHTPGQGMADGKCCPCKDCTCCAVSMREES